MFPKSSRVMMSWSGFLTIDKLCGKNLSFANSVLLERDRLCDCLRFNAQHCSCDDAVVADWFRAGDALPCHRQVRLLWLGESTWLWWRWWTDWWTHWWSLARRHKHVTVTSLPASSLGSGVRFDVCFEAKSLLTVFLCCCMDLCSVIFERKMTLCLLQLTPCSFCLWNNCDVVLCDCEWTRCCTCVGFSRGGEVGGRLLIYTTCRAVLLTKKTHLVYKTAAVLPMILS